jgi:hypothetical protein
MEDVLDLYAEALDPERPMVFFDESPTQFAQSRPEPTDIPYPRAMRASSMTIYLPIRPINGHLETLCRVLQDLFANNNDRCL